MQSLTVTCGAFVAMPDQLSQLLCGLNSKAPNSKA